MSRFLVAAMQSGSGKTVVTCGLLAAFQARGLDVRAFKCGPDYIDPMFHSRVLGTDSRNLDLFLQGEAGVKRTLRQHQGQLAVLESAMGYYDGIGGTEQGSAWEISKLTGTPVLLVLRPHGSSLTLAAQVKGMQTFRRESRIGALLLNDCSSSLYAHLKPGLERETGLPVLGYLPSMEEARFDSRHLGLMTAAEIMDLSERVSAVACQMEKTVDLDALLRLSAAAGEFGLPENNEVGSRNEKRPRIAVARDEAFCFYYADNLEALEAAGAELCFFSPLRDRVLPERIGGLYLGGGYPELHARDLSENTGLLVKVRGAVQAGLPTVAECGGFLYLQNSLQDTEGSFWPMAGVLGGIGVKKDRLQRFGYVSLTAKSDSLLFRTGETTAAHEFHYWDCTENGDVLQACKPVTEKTRRCGILSDSLYAGFPHLYMGGEIPMAERFVRAAARYREQKKDRINKIGRITE